MAEHQSVACSDFVSQLIELKELAGSPSLAELRKLSERTGTTGPKSRVLAESTTHDILARKRARPPEWRWVASFVRACHEAASVSGLDVSTLGSIQEWHDRWRNARAHQPPGTATPIPRRSQDQPSTPSPAHERPETSAAADPARAARSGASQTRRYLAAFGRTGTRLLRHSEAGDAKACVRLGVITLLRGWRGEAYEWLRRAAEAGDPNAFALLRSLEVPQLATELAYGYGREYELGVADKSSIAMLFYGLAADNGHAEAAYRLGLMYARKDDQWSAATWFGRAARQDHLPAEQEFDAISEQLSRATWNKDGALPAELMDAGPPEWDPSAASLGEDLLDG